MIENCWAVVVARTGPTAKSRLAEILPPSERELLALAMLEDVLGACVQASFSGLVLVTECEAGQALGRALGARVIRDDGRGLNQAVEQGLAAVSHTSSVVVLPGDVPWVTRIELEMLDASAGPSETAVVVATDRAGDGTNALLLRPSRVVRPSFGAGSAARHVAAGQAAGARTRKVLLPGLAHDVDLPTHLRARPATEGSAVHAFLERLDRTARPETIVVG